MKAREKEAHDIAKKTPGTDVKSILNRYDKQMYLKYSHCEIHPSMLFGIVANNIPFMNHNQGPRNMFQYSQARQAQGIPTSNYKHRLDISYALYHPAKPLVTTRSMKYVHTDKLPASENAIVAIGVYTGYNQEDSIIVNKSALDRGLFRSEKLKKSKTEIKKNQSTSQDDIFTKPDRNTVIGMKYGSYDKLNEKGYVPEETYIVKNDIILAKISPIQPIGASDKSFKDCSEAYKENEPGRMDKVITDIYNQDGYAMMKARTRSMRKPEMGDKFCSRHG